jgi:hypothetical protein
MLNHINLYKLMIKSRNIWLWIGQSDKYLGTDGVHPFEQKSN